MKLSENNLKRFVFYYLIKNKPFFWTLTNLVLEVLLLNVCIVYQLIVLFYLHCDNNLGERI